MVSLKQIAKNPEAYRYSGVYASNKKLREWVKEEKDASAMYEKYGFYSLAEDEAEHNRFLKSVLKARKGG
jgi:rubrerythrin